MSLKVLKFSATWCAPCRVLAKTLEDVPGITNIDIEKDMETARKYGVRQVPTIIFEKEGIEVGRVSGAISKKAYEEYLEKLK